MHDLNVALYRNHMVDPVATALIFVFYSLTSVVIYRHWYDYAKQCYENKKISYASKVVITALTTTLLVLTSILDIMFVFISLKAQEYFIYTKSMAHHIKLSWTTSATFIDIVYLYKLMIVMVITQLVYAVLPLAMLQMMKFVRSKQKVIIND